MSAVHQPFVVEKVRVLRDGALGAPEDVVVSDGRIARDAPDAAVIDGRGLVLMPGLIDTHVHVETAQQLQSYGRWGVTTALDMGTPNREAARALRARRGFADLRSAGSVACAPGGVAVRRMGYPPSSAVHGPDDAPRFVADRVREGADFIKIVLEEHLPFRPKPLDDATVRAIVRAAHRSGLLACVHATSVASFLIAARAGADVLTHVPLAGTFSPDQAALIAASGTAVSPTLTMMKMLVEHFPLPIKPKRISYANPVDAVHTLRRAGVRIIAGTDANSDPTAPNTIGHGVTVHDELALLVHAGLTPADALTAATAAAADVFDLTDRGRVSDGLRADLLLIEGDPTVDILATRNIRAVWIAGEEVR